MNRLLMAAGAAAIAMSSPAAALKINLIDGGGVTGSPAQRGFAVAARYWESVLTNDAKVNILVGFEDLGPNILGGTSTALYIAPVDFYQFFLGLNSTSALDAIAVSNLSPLNAAGGIDVKVPGYIDPLAKTGINPFTSRLATEGNISTDVAISGANVRALGFDLGDAIDAQIVFSSTFDFDFEPTNGIRSGAYDFIGVAIHEIGHALGFLSGAEDFDFFAPFSAGSTIDDVWWGYTMDMFRYVDGGLDWRPGQDAYFSIDGGASALFDGYFSTGSNYGDGWQASHWKSPGDCGTFLGIMNPYICNGQNDDVSALDLALLDAIGWNIKFDVLANSDYRKSTAELAGVPEPQAWAMMLTGFGAVGFAMRRRRGMVARPALA
jgi:hypothetical protein